MSKARQSPTHRIEADARKTKSISLIAPFVVCFAATDSAELAVLKKAGVI
jgi:hypothetical protein